MPLRVLSIFGTRPEAIKMAPILRLLGRISSRRATSIVCVTAQHREMLDQVLTVFGIVPDVDLDLMRPDQGVGDFAAAAFPAINRVLDDVRPDVVVVQGDTTTAAIAGIAAFYRRIPVAHVEAGLRTNDPENPFPEEINRRLLDVASRYHFAPTASAARALRAEGYRRASIVVTGNTVVDALRYIVRQTGVRPARPRPGEPLIVVTAHRREAFGPPLRRICAAILEIARRLPTARVVFPMHLNPNVRVPVERLLSGHPRIELIEPLPYDAFVRLMAGASLMITDSGGIQEEAPALGVPVVIVRQKTERSEAVRAGAARLAGTTTRGIVSATLATLARPRRVRRDLFGDGRAAERIVRVLLGGPQRAPARRRS